eukprot:m.246341 g.246341  ORF g.246341 m.246341 type:complete len:566 (-) comp42633_c0_seq1:158-1855(-)
MANSGGGAGAEELAMMDLRIEMGFKHLALAGQRLLRAGQHQAAIEALELALDAQGPPAGMGIVHSQLGACYAAIGKPEQAIKHHQADLQIARESHDLAGVAKAFASIGNVFKACAKYNESILCYEQQLDVARLAADRAAQCRALANLGGAYQAVSHAWLKKEESDMAADYCAQAVKYTKQNARLAEHLKDKAAMGKAYGNLGILYEQLEEHDKAALCHKKRLKIAQEAGDRAAEGRAFCNLGNAYRAQRKYDKAIECYEQDLAIAEEMGDTLGQAVTLSNLGNTHQAMGHVPETLHYHERHLAAMRATGDSAGVAWALANLARVCEAVGRYDDALMYLEKQAESARVGGDPSSEREVNASISRVRHLRDSGVTLEQHAAIQALLGALETAGSKTRAKRTIRSTVGRFFSRKSRSSSTHPGEVELGDSVGAGSDRASLSELSLGSVRSTLSITSFPSSPRASPRPTPIPPDTDSKRPRMPARLSALFSGSDSPDSGSPQPAVAVSEVDTEEGLMAQTDLGAASWAEGSEAMPAPLARHRATAEALLQQLGLLDLSMAEREDHPEPR